jgi:hypothetical protein
MTIPMWVQQEAYEAYMQEEEAFQEWLAEIDAYYAQEIAAIQEYQTRPVSCKTRTKRRCYAY